MISRGHAHIFWKPVAWSLSRHDFDAIVAMGPVCFEGTHTRVAVVRTLQGHTGTEFPPYSTGSYDKSPKSIRTENPVSQTPAPSCSVPPIRLYDKRWRNTTSDDRDKHVSYLLLGRSYVGSMFISLSIILGYFKIIPYHSNNRPDKFSAVELKRFPNMDQFRLSFFKGLWIAFM